MYTQITIKTLFKQGKGISEIANKLGCHRNTVSKIVKGKIKEKQTRDRSSVFDQYKSRIEELKGQNISRFRIWEKLQEEYGVLLTYNALCKYMQSNGIGRVKEAFIVQDTMPGEESEVDFGFAGLIPTSTGSLVKVWFFIMTLSYSRDAYYEAVTDQSIETFIKCHIHSFEYFTGVPQRVKIDNLKAAVIIHRRYDIELNRQYLEFAQHYNFVIAPCTPRQPHQKGKVESGVGYVKKNFIAGRSFKDLQDLKTQLHAWMTRTANQRIHGTTKKIPHEQFLTIEKQYLQKMPENPYTFYVTLTRKVAANCHIHVDNNYYSVPSQLVGNMVEVRIQDHLLSVFESETSKLVATHLLSQGKGEYVTNLSHYPNYKMYSQTALQAKYEEQMRYIGPHAHKLFLKVLQRDKGMWGITIRKILGLLPMFGKDKLEAAIKRALSFNATGYKILKNICENNLEKLELEPTLLESVETTKVNDIKDKLKLGLVSDEENKEDQSKAENLNEDISKEETMKAEPTVPEKLDRDLSYYTKH